MSDATAREVPAGGAAPDGPGNPDDASSSPGGPARWRGPADRALRVAGVLVTVALAVLTGLLELVLVPLRVGNVPVLLCVVLAVVVNYRLPRFAEAATGARWPALVAFAAWLVLMLAAAGRTSEGDLLVQGGIGLLVNLGGSLAFGVSVYRLLVSSPARPVPPGPPAADPA